MNAVALPLMYGEAGEATFSQDRMYRYALVRSWDPERPLGVFIGLNPSTADEERLDPTLRRVCRFLDREGCGSMVVLNLFAYRATQPAAMKTAKDPVGPDNDRWINIWTEANPEGPILVGWGANGQHRNRAGVVEPVLPKARTFCLGHCFSGDPKHPLYISSAAPFVPWP